jgi:hypothetical protein
VTVVSVEPAAPADVERAAAPARWRAALILVGLGAWWWPVAMAFGGRDAGAVTLGLLLLASALLAARVWRLPKRHLLALVPGLLAAAAVLWMPTRGDGLDEAAVWLSAGLVYLAAAGWLAQRGSVWLLLAPVGVGAVIQLWTGWWAWFGIGGSTSPMVGTFYWHNQLGAFMVAVSVTAATIVVHGRALDRPWVWGSAAVAALAGAGTIFSASRACVALLAAALVLLAITCIRVPRRLVALASVVSAIWAVAWLLTRLLPSSAGAGEALASRGQSAGGNAAARLDYVVAAWRIMGEYPWTGSGADSFGSTGPALVGPFPAPTQWVHNGFLQAFVDAGLVFGVAVTVAVLFVLVAGLRRLVIDERLLRRGQALDPVRTGAVLGCGALTVRAAFDFDWAYPVLAALLALLSAVVLSAPSGHEAVTQRPLPPAVAGWRGAVVALGLVLGLLSSAGIDAAAATGGTVPTWRTLATAGWAGGDLPQWLTPASQCRQEVQALVEADDEVPADQRDRLAQCLSRVAETDPSTVADLAALERLTGAGQR